jgi:hypothetical protein
VTASTGYSGTPLPQKLGLKDGQRVLFLGLPKELFTSLFLSRQFFEAADLEWKMLRKEPDHGYEYIHGFTASRAVLEDNAPLLIRKVVRDGAIWISWPKKTSKVETDITEDVIRDVVLPIGLVDVKVAAVDAIWSGLKLVIRKELR